MNNRRKLLVALGAGVLAPPAAWPQQKGQLRRVGFLQGTSDSDITATFSDELRKLGWVEGKNVLFEYRSAQGRTERLPALVAELVRLKVDLIVTGGTPGAQAAKAATSDIPIVFTMVSDPVASGIVHSLGRPGGNLTGSSNLLPETSRKLLELLKEVVPKASRIAVLFDPLNPGKQLEIKVLQAEARRAGLILRPLEVHSDQEIKASFSSMAQERHDGLVILQDAVTGSHRKEIVELAARYRLPAIYQTREFVDVGGLISYGMNRVEQWRRSALYVDKILRGTKPGDLPVEQPTRFELVVNMKSAKTLGITIPQAIVVRADKVIE